MASKLVSLTKLNRILFITTPKYPTISRPAYSSASSNNHQAQDDDAMTQGVDTQGESSDPKLDNNKDNITPTKEDDHYIRPKSTQSNMSSSKLQSPGVNTPIDPHVQQRRTLATNPKANLTCAKLDSKLQTLGVDTTVDPYIQQRRMLTTNPKAGLTCVTLDTKLQTLGVEKHVDPYVQKRRTLASNAKDDLTCAGLDGSPWPEDETASREEKEEDDKEYFKEHKASPLSKMEMGDTRKPLEKVAHGTADGYFGGEKVITWLPEQLDTAEESLLRAIKMFREAAARGVPEWPHSRRLRELRGEDW